MGVFASDAFTGTDAVTIGSPWTKSTAGGYTTGDIVFYNNRAFEKRINSLWYLATAPSADYWVQGDVVTGTAGSGAVAAIGGRLDSTSAFNGYWIDYYDAPTAGSRVVRIIRFGTGAGTAVLGSYTLNLGSAGTATLRLLMSGSSISGYVDGVLRIGPVTDTNLASAGRPFIYFDYGGSEPQTPSFDVSATGVAIDNFSASTLGSVPAPLRRRPSGLYTR